MATLQEQKTKIEEQKQKALDKAKKLEQKLKAIRGKEQAQQRKEETRRKILIGAMIIEYREQNKHLDINDDDAFNSALNEYLTREIDRKLFDF